MKSNAFRFALIFAFAAALASCSLKEDRTPCPCWLDIDITACNNVLDNRNNVEQTFKPNTVNIAAWNEKFIFEQKVGHDDYGILYEKPVPKGYVTTSVVAGEKKMYREDYNLLIPEGEDSDPVFAHFNHVPCFGEFARDTAVLHKQFARVIVKVVNTVGDAYPYTFKLRTNTRGIDLRNMIPIQGEVVKDLQRGADDVMTFNLIRQPEDGLVEIEVYKGDEKIHSFPVHDWIKEKGYDWNARNLRDININIDYAQGTWDIIVNDWIDGGSVEEIL